ncbi:MAG: hypothetical protein OEY01_11165 [Desulfobulbaceae bacterium]|nr:hypothetical protein [Desulfobulbaceae bacterium]
MKKLKLTLLFKGKIKPALLLFTFCFLLSTSFAQQQVINNGETGLVVRNKLNAMFEQIYDNLVNIQFSADGVTSWHEVYAPADNYFRTTQDLGVTWGLAVELSASFVVQFSADNITYSNSYTEGDDYYRFSTNNGVLWSPGIAITSEGVGDVVGPDGAIAENIATYDGSTGKLIQDGGYSIATILAAGNKTHVGDVSGDSVLTIGANKVNETHMDWGTGTDEINANDLPIEDTAGNFTATNTEQALKELAEAGTGTSTDISGIRDTLQLHRDSLLLVFDSLAVHRTAINLNTAKITFPGFTDLATDYSFTDDTGTDDQTAAEVNITDAGEYYTGTEVETALQEIGASIASGGDGWGADTVTTDITLLGDGTGGDILKIDTTVIATPNDIAVAVAAVTPNATHSGEVTGATALTIADDIIEYANLSVNLTDSLVNNTLTWDISGKPLIYCTPSTGTVAFSNPQVNKSITIILTLSSATLTWPATAKILDGSATLADGTFFIYIHCISTSIFTISITKEAA